jgi:hypothetical protein
MTTPCGITSIQTADKDALAHPIGGHVHRLCEAFVRPKAFKRVDRILKTKDYAFESERHIELAKALGLPATYARLGYRELSREDEDALNNSVYVQTLSRKQITEYLEWANLKGRDHLPYSDIVRQIRNLVSQNRKISAIALYQRYKGCSLDEARKHIETL